MRSLLVLVLLAPASSQDERAKLLKTFRQEFVPIPAGSFLMGNAAGGIDEKPVHEVTFKDSFHMARYEVPQNLWESVMSTNPSKWKGPRNSVEMLSFHDAISFCRKMTRLLQEAKLIEETQVIRLPSEAEWEYAARSGTKTKYSFGDDVKDLNDYAWHTGNAAGNDPPVGAKKPNAWKLYDMHGYLWEWCEDGWHDTYEGAPKDGSAWTQEGNPNRRVMRGGSWKDKADRLTCSFRWSDAVDFKDDAVGLRCVLAEVKK